MLLNRVFVFLVYHLPGIGVFFFKIPCIVVSEASFDSYRGIIKKSS